MLGTVSNIIRKYQHTFHQVVDFNAATDRLFPMDLTEHNEELTEEIFSNTDLFCDYVANKLKTSHSKYGIGGYNELRAVYGRSELFGASPDNNGNNGGEPRRLHLGTDIWGEAGTPVRVFMGGVIHSFAFNNHYGDYGATIVTLHQLDGVAFYTLYGHLSLRDIENISEQQYINHGQKIGHFGKPDENGHWPPHLHFQIIADMELKNGDYPGVCRYSEREKYLANCPDPDLILQLNRYLK